MHPAEEVTRVRAEHLVGEHGRSAEALARLEVVAEQEAGEAVQVEAERERSAVAPVVLRELECPACRLRVAQSQEHLRLVAPRSECPFAAFGRLCRLLDPREELLCS